MPAVAKKLRTWRLTARGGEQRFFEMSLPLDEAPDWIPPLETERFRWANYAPLELYLDGKLAVTGATWSEVLALAAKKLLRAKR